MSILDTFQKLTVKMHPNWLSSVLFKDISKLSTLLTLPVSFVMYSALVTLVLCL
jgi:hypothetical protein